MAQTSQRDFMLPPLAAAQAHGYGPEFSCRFQRQQTLENHHWC